MTYCRRVSVPMQMMHNVDDERRSCLLYFGVYYDYSDLLLIIDVDVHMLLLKLRDIIKLKNEIIKRVQLFACDNVRRLMFVARRVIV
jgi:hypothetical protein